MELLFYLDEHLDINFFFYIYHHTLCISIEKLEIMPQMLKTDINLYVIQNIL